MNPPHISIVILNYNGYQDTIECLDSIFKINYRDFKIILVDNGSQNNSIQKIREWLKQNDGIRQQVFVIESKENLGFARGNNLGIRYALANFKSEYILALNNDTLVEPDFLSYLLEAMQKFGAALVGPKILEPNTKDHWQGYFMHRINIFNYIAFLTPLRQIFVNTPMAVEFKLSKMSSPLKVYSIPGCCMLFRSDIIEEIGLFDEKTFLGWEECIIAEKLFKLNYSTYVVPKSRIYHKVTKDTASIPLDKRKKNYLESEKYFQENYLKMHRHQILLIGIIRKFLLLITGILSKRQQNP